VPNNTLFIVFEGVDGSGTTTQAELLARFLEELGHAVVLTREPGGTPTAERIRELVLNPELRETTHLTELFLYAASRAQHVEEKIVPSLAEGKIVICDRFTASTLAYQAYGRGLDIELVEKINSYAVGDCCPDLTIFLELSIEEARQRRLRRAVAPDRLEEAGDRLQMAVARAYKEIAHQQADFSLVVDARPAPETIAESIFQELVERWPWLDKTLDR